MYAIPKSASTSIKIYLEKYSQISIGSVKSQDGYNIEYNPEWNNYFQFAFIRNPWDRILSCFLDKTKRSIGTKDEVPFYRTYKDYTFEEFVNVMDSRMIYWDGHMTPQTMLINLDNIDFIGRFENLKHDVGLIQQYLHMPIETISHENQSIRLDYREYFNNKTKDKIYKLYRMDIMRFDYEF
jgi:hypothetical protein